ncbi:hypothetical protein WG66_007657, partial [Moniliophthora roreri]
EACDILDNIVPYSRIEVSPSCSNSSIARIIGSTCCSRKDFKEPPSTIIALGLLISRNSSDRASEMLALEQRPQVHWNP